MVDTITAVDFAVLDWIQANLRCAPLDSSFRFFSYIGNSGTIWIILTIVLILFRQTRTAGICMGICLLTGYLCGEVFLKNLVQRARPCVVRPISDALLANPLSFSFPSGHTTSSFTASTALALCKPWGKYAWILAALIAFSRLYCYVHFPTDVLCGIALGVSIALVLTPRVRALCEHRCFIATSKK